RRVDVARSQLNDVPAAQLVLLVHVRVVSGRQLAHEVLARATVGQAAAHDLLYPPLVQIDARPKTRHRHRTYHGSERATPGPRVSAASRALCPSTPSDGGAARAVPAPERPPSLPR